MENELYKLSKQCEKLGENLLSLNNSVLSLINAQILFNNSHTHTYLGISTSTPIYTTNISTTLNNVQLQLNGNNQSFNVNKNDLGKIEDSLKRTNDLYATIKEQIKKNIEILNLKIDDVN